MDSGDIETLSVRFHFIEESLAEIKNANQRLVQETQDTQSKIKDIFVQTHVDLKSLQDDYVKHRVELSGKETELELKHRKESLEVIKKQVLEHTEDLGARDSLLKPLNADIDNVNEKLQVTKGHLTGMKEIVKDTSQYLGISGSTIAEIGSIGGLIALAFTAVGEIRRYERSVAISAAGGGQVLGVEELANIGAYTKSLTNVGGLNLQEKEAQGVVSGLMSIGGVTPKDITGGLGERAARMGMGIGEGPLGAIDMIRTMVSHLQIPIQQVESEFDKLRKTSVQLGDTQMQYLHTTLETADSLRLYNVSLGTTADVLANFWDRIKHREISMEQVTGLLKLGSTESMGQLAYGGALAAQYGSHRMQTALGGKSAIQQVDVMQQMLEGTYGSDDQERKKNFEDVLQFYGQQALQAGPDRVTQAMMFKTMTGRDIFSSMRADEQGRFLQDMATGQLTDAEQRKIHEGMGRAKTIDNVVDGLQKIQDPVQEMVKILKDIAQMVGGGVLALVGWVTGSKQLTAEGKEMVMANLHEFEHMIGFDTAKTGADAFGGLGPQASSWQRVSNLKEMSMLQKQFAEAKAHGMLSGGTSERTGEEYESFLVDNHIYLHYSDGHIEKIVNKTLAKKKGPPGRAH